MAAAVEGPVTSMITASALQLHCDCTFYLDGPSTKDLKMLDYFQWVQSKLPGAPHSA